MRGTHLGTGVVLAAPKLNLYEEDDEEEEQEEETCCPYREATA